MKLFRHGAPGSERPGALDAAGKRRDLSLLVPDLTPEWMAPEKLAALAAIDLTRLPEVASDVRLGPPVAGTRQFVCIGLNYRKHAEESGLPIPTEPVVFTKSLTCISGPDDDIVLPAGSTATDWEVELGFVIGKVCRNVSEADALGHIAGYFLANDVSERDWQLKRGGQWSKGKSFDTFGPIGPWLVTADEVANPQDIALQLSVDGVSKQLSSTSDQIFSVAFVVAYLSSFMTLLPGDLVITGTPEGVGLGAKPPEFLRQGAIVELSGGVLGKQRQNVR